MMGKGRGEEEYDAEQEWNCIGHTIKRATWGQITRQAGVTKIQLSVHHLLKKSHHHSNFYDISHLGGS